MKKAINTGNLTRFFNLDRSEVDEEARTVNLSFSSEAPVERFFGNEVLSHDPKHVDLGRLNDGAPLLMDHNTSDQIGRVESAMVDGKRGQAVVRFSKSARGSEIFNDVIDGIRQNISVGYRINEMQIDESRSEGDVETFVATNWQPFEVSVVSVPADYSVGISRSAEGENVTTITNFKGEKTMSEEIQKTEPVTAPAAPTVDSGAIARKAVEADRQRSSEIDAITEKHPELSDVASQFKANDRSLSEFRKVALESISKSKPAAAISDSSIGMSPKEAQQFSVVRAINALTTNNWAKAGYELEASKAQAQKLGKDARGFFLPTDVQRDLNVGTATAGGHTVSTDLLTGNFIDMLRNKMTVMDLGATMLTGLSGNVAVPRQTGGSTAYWVAESGAVTESAAAFDQVAMSPKTVGAFSDLSRKLLLQSSMDIESFVRNDLATTLAIEIDRAAIHGSASSNQPRGILATSGIGSVVGGTNGVAPTYAHIVGLETQVAQDNADEGALNFLTNSKVRGKLLQTEKASSTAQFVWADNNTLRGYNAAVSNQVSSTLTKGNQSLSSAIIFGNWNDLLIGMWGGLDIAVDTSTGSSSGTVRVVCLSDVDIAVRHAQSFAAMLDANAA
jgi:HK97 family phage major capsid protein/HK97 family phage prohead protease